MTTTARTGPAAQDAEAKKIRLGRWGVPGSVAAPDSTGFPVEDEDEFDLSTPLGPVHAVYQVLSGAAGQPRDWARLRGMFAPGGHMVPLRRPDGTPVLEVLTVEDYERTRAPVLASMDFYESELAARVDVFGDVAHVLSSYEARRSPNGAPFMRGVNSIQLVRDRGRWWILSVVWDTERDGNPIPADLLPPA
ncbi:MAG: hypothetical protein JWM27_1663 [Gemmatimonadetes bacterium]|nr:hypothetical protein [Gemmatimonadota bacterium]